METQNKTYKEIKQIPVTQTIQIFLWTKILFDAPQQNLASSENVKKCVGWVPVAVLNMCNQLI